MTARVRRVLGVVGSLRRDSFNSRLLYVAATLAPERLGITVAPDLIRLPLFDQDLEADGLPAEVQAMQEQIRAADGVLLATPEYNFGVPGPVKNSSTGRRGRPDAARSSASPSLSSAPPPDVSAAPCSRRVSSGSHSP